VVIISCAHSLLTIMVFISCAHSLLTIMVIISCAHTGPCRVPVYC
jgi:hypothetical protein